MTDSTTYRVDLKYHVESSGGRRGASALNEDVKQLERTNKSAAMSFGLLGTAAAAAFGFAIAKGGSALVGFNSTVQDTKLQIAGMLALAKKTDLADQIGTADRVFADLQKRAASLPGTTMEYVKMAGMLTQPITDAGLGIKDLEDLTVNSVVAAKALGVEWQAAARDVDQALRGQFHSIDVFTGKILGSIGYKGEEGRAKFNALSGDKRASELRRAEMQDSISQLATAQGQTFTGVLSTLVDSFEQTMGKVGLPLFQSITKEIIAWNKWLDANAVKVNEIAHTVGTGIADGFRVMKDAVGFLVAHQGEMMALGKVWIAVKVGSMLGSRAGGAGSAAVGRASALAAWGRGARDSFDADGNYQYQAAGAGRAALTGKSLLANAGLLAQTAALGYAFGTLIRSNSEYTAGMDENMRGLKKLELQGKAFGDALDNAAAKMGGPRAVSNIQGSADDYRRQANTVAKVIKEFQSASGGPLNYQGIPTSMNSSALRDAQAKMERQGIGSEDIAKAGGMQSFVNQMNAKADALFERQQTLTREGRDAFEFGMMAMTDYQRQTLDAEKASQDVLVYLNSHGLKFDAVSILDIMRAATADPTGKHKTIAEKPKVNVHIARIEVQSDDPDRIAFGLIEQFRDAAKNPSSAFHSIREG